MPERASELLKVPLPDSEIRTWIKETADYQKVPLEITATILQQENGANATIGQKVLQFGERSLTTVLQIADEALWDIVPDRAFGKSIANGSSGIANLQRPTLRSAAEYSETTLHRPPLPDDVRYRAFGWDQDTRIPGDDLKSDIYYQAAHVRQLIDRVTGMPGYSGDLTLPQVRAVFKAYNGSGPVAEKYSNDAMKKLQNAAAGQGTLYFYQP